MRPSTMERLKTQHETIEYLLSGLPEESIKRRVIPDKWSIHEQVAHLGRYQEIFWERLQHILTENSPTFAPYRADDEPEFLLWVSYDITKNLEAIKELRRELVALITSLKNEELSLTGTHQRFGAMSIERWVEFFLLHEAHHLFSIFALAGQMR